MTVRKLERKRRVYIDKGERYSPTQSRTRRETLIPERGGGGKEQNRSEKVYTNQ